ncbi:hypothetical protein GTA08_BOTSDO12277 [Neofusicoccum parvum]|nr:hypothetical protein GTA08_BOTSDO12277 [Neofusicoccum parvum]
MSDYGYDSDEFDLYDDGWLYIAEEDHLADDLAERAIASPPPREYDLDGSGYNSDYFEYWVDIEYNSDGWNDVKPSSKTNVSNKNQSAPKKRKKAAQGGPSQKKRKGAHGRQLSAAVDQPGDKLPTVLWQSREERVKQDFEGPRALSEEPKESFALLRDWRTRFGPAAREAKGKKAAVEVEETTDVSGDASKLAKAEEMDEETASAEADGDGLESLIAGSGLDPQALMRALQENLEASGAAQAGLDQSTLLKYALKMLSGEDEADDIAGELADEMFDQAEEEDPEGKDIAEWATKQRTHPENGEKKQSGVGDDEASESEPKSKATLPPTPPTTNPAQDESSGPKKGKKKDTEEPPATSAAGTRSRKRKASEPAPDDEPPPRPKRATRSYAAPTATSKAKTAGGKGGKGKRG